MLCKSCLLCAVAACVGGQNVVSFCPNVSSFFDTYGILGRKNAGIGRDSAGLSLDLLLSVRLLVTCKILQKLCAKSVKNCVQNFAKTNSSSKQNFFDHYSSSSFYIDAFWTIWHRYSLVYSFRFSYLRCFPILLYCLFLICIIYTGFTNRWKRNKS